MELLIYLNQYSERYLVPLYLPVFMIVIVTVFVVTMIWVLRNRHLFPTLRSRCEGGMMVVDVSHVDGHNYRARIGSAFYMFTSARDDPSFFSLSFKAVGIVEAQQGSRLRIALVDTWERIDEFTIREVLSPAREEWARKYDYLDWEYLLYEYKIGKSFPFGQGGGSRFITYATPYAKVLQLYLPSDNASSNGGSPQNSESNHS